MMADVVIEVVGGKHDGASGLVWGGVEQPPQRIVVGTCAGRGECSSGVREWCRMIARQTSAAGRYALGRDVRHPAYWTLDEVDLPRDGQVYCLKGLIRDGENRKALYVVGGAPARRGDHEEGALTVDDILAAAPRLPGPATVAAQQLADDRHRRYWPRMQNCRCQMIRLEGGRDAQGRWA